MKHEGLIVGLLIVTVVCSAAALALGIAHLPRTSRVVAATGTAQKSFVPDTAHLDLGVQTDAPEVQKAQQDNLATMKGVLAALKAAGVKSEDIQTSSFYVNQTFDYSSGKSSKPTGWQVTNTVTVRVKPDLVSAVIDAASRAGANSFNSISFDISNREELKAGLMKDAVANARAKAVGTLEGTTHTLGDIVSIAADWSGPPVIYSGAGGGMGDAGYVPVEAGTNVLSVSVSVSFELD
jgi:uncharacterized protein YggE